MRLYHVSPSKNDNGIRRYGLLGRFCRGGNATISLVSRDCLEWALELVEDRHGVPDVTVWVVNLPPSWVKKRWLGLYDCDRDIPPARIDGRLAVTETGSVLL